MGSIKRNNQIDLFRGIAMLLVVLGHTISVGASDSNKSTLLNIIWTLQMPLFMMISGYVTRYSKKLFTRPDLWQFVKRRTLAYLIPWIIWTFIVRGLICGRSEFFDLKHLLWNMDSGYWFLTSIWTITILFGVAQYIAIKICKNEKIWFEIFITAVAIALEAIVLLLVGSKLGISFFGIRFSIYYLPFYFMGYLYSKVQDVYESRNWFIDTCKCGIAVSAIIYIVLLIRVNFYAAGDSLGDIVLRVLASVTGCVSVFGLLGTEKNTDENRISSALAWIGKNSLGIYVSHGLFIDIFKSTETVYIGTLNGFVYIAMNFLVTTLMSFALIRLVQRNQFLNKVLFYK